MEQFGELIELDGVNIYLEDSGYTELTGFSTRFPTFDTANSTQKQFGEFRAPNRIMLKVNSINIGDSQNTQDVPNTQTIQSSYKSISKNPISISLGGYIEKPRSFNKIQQKDLPKLATLALMQLTKGHKDLYLDSTINEDERKKLFSLWYFTELFGRQDNGNSAGAKHLNVAINDYSINESVRTLSVNIQMTLLELNL